jgi:hypothetical protein
MKDKTKWSYLAAMIDGEGCISISRAPIRFKSPTYYPQVRVAGTSLELMKWLVRYFGGNYYASDQGTSRTLYTWQVNGAKNRKTVLLGVLPYLIIKREQAKLMLQFLEIGQEHNPSKRDEFRNQIAALNSGHWQSAKQSQSQPVTTNTPNTLDSEVKIESDLMGDHERALAVTQVA